VTVKTPTSLAAFVAAGKSPGRVGRSLGATKVLPASGRHGGDTSAVVETVLQVLPAQF
jgi:hypothetical protein